MVGEQSLCLLPNSSISSFHYLGWDNLWRGLNVYFDTMSAKVYSSIYWKYSNISQSRGGAITMPWKTVIVIIRKLILSPKKISSIYPTFLNIVTATTWWKSNKYVSLVFLSSIVWWRSRKIECKSLKMKVEKKLLRLKVISKSRIFSDYLDTI